jgi:rRNA maturation protein Nop10
MQGINETETCPACGQPMKEARHIDPATGKSLQGPVLRWCANEQCSRYTVVEPGISPTGLKDEPAAK